MQLSCVCLDAVCGGSITIDSLCVVSGLSSLNGLSIPSILSSLRDLSGVGRLCGVGVLGGGRPLGREGDDGRRLTSRQCSAGSFGAGNGVWLDAVNRPSTLLGGVSVLGSVSVFVLCDALGMIWVCECSG